MKAQVKAIRSKPMVSLNVAVGTLNMQADDLVDAAMLVAIYHAIYRGDPVTKKVEKLRLAINAAAKEKLQAMYDHKPTFEMTEPRKKKVET